MIFVFAEDRTIGIRFEGERTIYTYNQASIINRKPAVSLELISDRFGMKYEYNEKNETIKGEIGDIKAEFRLGSKYIYINNERIKLDTAPIKINGTIMLPSDFIRKVFNGKMSWDEKKWIVNVYRDNNVEVHFIDVSEGECILIDYKDYCILINSGGEMDGGVISNYLKNQGIKDIQLYISTNYNLEETNGLKQIMENFNIYQIIHLGDAREITEINNYITLMPSNNVIELAQLTDRKIDLGCGVELDLMELDNSILASLKHNNVKILLTGDIDDEDIDIIKVADHETEMDGTIVVTTDGEKYDIDTRQYTGIFIRQIDFINQKLVVYNQSRREYDLGGCIVKDKDNNEYHIKENSIVESGYQRIFNLMKEGEELDTNRNWIPRANFYTDYGILYDTKGNIIAITPKY